MAWEDDFMILLLIFSGDVALHLTGELLLSTVIRPRKTFSSTIRSAFTWDSRRNRKIERQGGKGGYRGRAVVIQ